MAGLTFTHQNRTQRPAGLLIPVILVIVCVLLITTSMSMGNTGVYGVVRTGVQTVAAPLQRVCSVVSEPFRSLGNSAVYSTEEVEQLQLENGQLRTLVAELEEYRQQNQRLAVLLQLSDTYALETVSGKALSVTKGWNQTATLNVGTDNGVQVGMGVISSCGLYGQVISVTDTTATVRLVSDAESSVAAMVQGTRATGIVSGSYDGTLTLDYISADEAVGEGDVVITSGAGGAYPRGIVIGTVTSVELDSSKLYYRLGVEPVFGIDMCEEVLVLTGGEDETASLVDIDLLNTVVASGEAVSDGSTAGEGDGNDATAGQGGSEGDDTQGADASGTKDDGTPQDDDATTGADGDGEDG